MVLGALGTIGVVVSMFLPWRNGGVHPSDVPFAFLFDSTTTARNPSLLIALIPLAVILAVGSVMPRASGARIIGALGGMLISPLLGNMISQVISEVFGQVMTVAALVIYLGRLSPTEQQQKIDAALANVPANY